MGDCELGTSQLQYETASVGFSVGFQGLGRLQAGRISQVEQEEVLKAALVRGWWLVDVWQVEVWRVEVWRVQMVAV